MSANELAFVIFFIILGVSCVGFSGYALLQAVKELAAKRSQSNQQNIPQK